MRALTGSDVLVEDKLFATLDTTVRALQPPRRSPRVLVSDTVGFIKKLPHDLVASFRSTLDEARDARAAAPRRRRLRSRRSRAQIEVTREVLAEIGAPPRARASLLLNKADRLDADAARAARARSGPTRCSSPRATPADVAALRERILAFFERGAVEAELARPLRAAEAWWPRRTRRRASSRRTHDERGTRLRVRGKADLIDRIQSDLRRGQVPSLD